MLTDLSQMKVSFNLNPRTWVQAPRMKTYSPADPFPILEPQHPSIDVSELHKFVN